MNDRIRELKEQALRFAQEKCQGQPRDMHGTLRSDIMTEKFAQLIVQDCIDQFCQSGAVSTDGSIVVGVKKHFGVE